MGQGARQVFGSTLIALFLPIVISSHLVARDAGTIDAAQTQELATALVRANDAWGEKISSHGAVLSLVETARHGGRITYRLQAKGLPTDHVYALIQWPVTQKEPSAVLDGVTISESGYAVCAGKPGTCGDPTNPDDPIDLQTAPVQGEPLRFALVAHDDPNLRAAVKTVPVPNSAVDNNCRIDAVLLMPHAELIWLEASRFPAGTALTLTQNSAGDVQVSHPRTDGTGSFAWAILPSKAGAKSGTVQMELKAPDCSPRISVAWGPR